MRKRVLLALVLVVAMLASTGCKLIVKDEAVDRATPIIEVAGKTYTKGEVNDQLTLMLDYYAQMYSAYGMAFDAKDEQTIADMRSMVINGLIDEAVITGKIVEGGYDQLSEEKKAEIQATVDEDYQLYYDTTKKIYFSKSELTGDELTKAVEAEMVSQGYPTYEEMLETELLKAAQTNLREAVVKDVTVSEEEIATEYQTRVDAAKATYDAMPAAYGNDVTNGAEIYYTPAGYRYVKHVLVSYTDEDQAAISDLESQLSSKKLSLAADKENETLKAEVADLTAQLDAAKAAADANIQATVDAVAAKISEGADFNALIEEYNTDPGMTADAVGYLVSEASTNWVQEFKNASMALAKVGDVSGAVKSSYGVHFIKYESDAVEGPVALETVKEAIAEELLSNKQDAFYNNTIDQWITEANPKVYEDRL